MILLFNGNCTNELGKLRFSLEDKRMKELAESLHKVFSLAEEHPGFIWRISESQSKVQLFELGFDKLISSTVSVWKDSISLKDFTYNFLHGVYLKRNFKWFKKVHGPQLVIWNVENNYQPTFKKSFDRLEYLKNNGSSDYAHEWKR